MGRKSKKQLLIDKKPEIIWNIGIYTRLSSDDGDNSESDSIRNQKELIRLFLGKEKDTRIVEIYADDGFSGTSFNRPDFNRMLDDINKGKINTVVVKDLSRLGRNYIEAGNYLEHYFPTHNVRFISINDNIDSYKNPESINNLIVPFKNLLNDEYARDVSIKVKSVYRAKALEGKFCGGTCPYGYKRTSEDKYKLVVVPSEAKVVKLIFKRSYKGDGRIKIVKYLNDNHIYCRKEIQRRLKHHIPDLDKKTIYNWNTSTIGRLLENPVYCGDCVMGKSSKVSYKSKQQIYNPKSKWIIVKNTHEPIIDRETFKKMQESIKERSTRKETVINKNKSIYEKILKCADCKRAMTHMVDNRKEKLIDYYVCSNYARISNDCTSHKIRTSDLDQMVLETIHLQINLIIDLEKELKKIRKKDLNLTREEEFNYRDIELKNELVRIKKLKQICYEDWKLGNITAEDYFKFTKNYDNNILNIQSEIEHNKTNHLNYINNFSNNNVWIRMFKKHKNMKSITKEALEDIVESIYVEDNQNIRIVFKYSNKYIETLNYLKEKKEQK